MRWEIYHNNNLRHTIHARENDEERERQSDDHQRERKKKGCTPKGEKEGGDEQGLYTRERKTMHWEREEVANRGRKRKREGNKNFHVNEKNFPCEREMEWERERIMWRQRGGNKGMERRVVAVERRRERSIGAIFERNSLRQRRREDVIFKERGRFGGHERERKALWRRRER